MGWIRDRNWEMNGEESKKIIMGSFAQLKGHFHAVANIEAEELTESNLEQDMSCALFVYVEGYPDSEIYPAFFNKYERVVVRSINEERESGAVLENGRPGLLRLFYQKPSKNCIFIADSDFDRLMAVSGEESRAQEGLFFTDYHDLEIEIYSFDTRAVQKLYETKIIVFSKIRYNVFRLNELKEKGELPQELRSWKVFRWKKENGYRKYVDKCRVDENIENVLTTIISEQDDNSDYNNIRKELLKEPECCHLKKNEIPYQLVNGHNYESFLKKNRFDTQNIKIKYMRYSGFVMPMYQKISEYIRNHYPEIRNRSQTKKESGSNWSFA